MRIVLLGKSATRVCAWRSYASLRDNVQRLVAQGRPAKGFQTILGIEGALHQGRRCVDARQLREEVLQAWSALWRSHLDGQALESVPSTAADAAPIPREARRFILSALVLTESAAEGDILEVLCVAEGSRVVRRGQANQHHARQSPLRLHASDSLSRSEKPCE